MQTKPLASLHLADLFWKSLYNENNNIKAERIDEFIRIKVKIEDTIQAVGMKWFYTSTFFQNATVYWLYLLYYLFSFTNS